MRAEVYRAVLTFENGDVMLLTKVRRDKYGRVESGFVVNGAWFFKVVGDEHLAFENERDVKPLMRIPAQKLISEIQIPSDVLGNADEVIEWSKAHVVQTRHAITAPGNEHHIPS